MQNAKAARQSGSGGGSNGCSNSNTTDADVNGCENENKIPSPAELREKHDAVAAQFSGVPDLMKSRAQWLCWKWETTKSGKRTKVPKQAKTVLRGKLWNASSINRQSWCKFDTAIDALVTSRVDGIGFVFEQTDGLVGIDLDHVSGERRGAADEIIDQFGACTYIEVSPSGDGYHIIGLGKAPRCGKGEANQWIEVYDYTSPRFFTVTGDSLTGNTIEDCQAPVDWLFANFKPESEAGQRNEDEEGSRQSQSTESQNGSGKPGDDFNARSSWTDVLCAHGWTFLRKEANGDESWLRPGGSDRRSALVYSENGLLYICSDKAQPLEKGKCYSRFAAYALLNHDGDFKAAAKALAQQGYGDRKRKEKRMHDDENHQDGTTDGAQSRSQTAGNDDDGSALSFSEDSLASAFTRTYKDQLIYVEQSRAWFQWTGRVWEREQECEVFGRARLVCRPVSKQAGLEGKKIARACTYAAVEKIARSDHSIKPEQLNSDPMLLNTPAGILDLRTGDIRAANPGDYMTLITAVAPREMATPVFDRFLERVQPDEEIRSYLFRRWGYCLTGDVREQCLFFDRGQGANGKGTCIWIQMQILGPYAATAQIDLLTESQHDRHSTELAGLHRARLVAIPETQQGRRWNEARLKMMTGEDKIRCRFMRRDDFEYLPQLKLSILGQHFPRLTNNDHAMRRRLQFLEWPIIIPDNEVDKELKQKLDPELPGIFHRIILGCLDWQRNGLKIPDAVRKATGDYFASQDSVSRWLSDCCDTEGIPEEFTSTRMLLEDFTKWCRLENVPTQDSNWLGKQLVEKGFEGVHKKIGNGFKGIRLKAIRPSQAQDSQASSE